MPSCSSLASPSSQSLPRGSSRPRAPRASVRVAASRGDGQRRSIDDEQSASLPPTSTSPTSALAQRAAAGAAALLLSLSPAALSPPPAWPATSVKYLTRDELSTVELFRRATPSVVFVTALGERRDALTLDVTQMPQGAGSGVVWDAEGHVVTNYHVVKDAKELRVTVSGSAAGGKGGSAGAGAGAGGGEFRARLVGADPDRDVALLQLAPFADPSPEDDDEDGGEDFEEYSAGAEAGEAGGARQRERGAAGLDGEGEGEEEVGVVGVASPSSPSTSSPASSPSPAPFPPSPKPSPRRRPPPSLRPRPPLVPLRRGTSAGLEVGQTVYAIGNPFGLSSTLTKGVLSGVGREIASGITGRPLENVLQSDAAINPGERGKGSERGGRERTRRRRRRKFLFPSPEEKNQVKKLFKQKR